MEEGKEEDNESKASSFSCVQLSFFLCFFNLFANIELFALLLLVPSLGMAFLILSVLGCSVVSEYRTLLLLFHTFQACRLCARYEKRVRNLFREFSFYVLFIFRSFSVLFIDLYVDVAVDIFSAVVVVWCLPFFPIWLKCNRSAESMAMMIEVMLSVCWDFNGEILIDETITTHSIKNSI